jgi:hypothetical protein
VPIPVGSAAPVYEVVCHYCGYVSPDGTMSRACPKCHGNSWERSPIPGNLLHHIISTERTKTELIEIAVAGDQPRPLVERLSG